MRVAYLTSQYPATSHTFIAREVQALRRLGCDLQTFSIRPASAAELTAAADKEAAATTFTVLDQSLARFGLAHLGEVVRHPVRYARTLGTALTHRAPGVRAGLLALAHFGEAILLAAELRRRRVDRLHNHFANSAATVGLLAAKHLSLPWSFTIHGISEFDYPAGLTLPAKLRAASFVACVSYFGRAQAMRVVEPAHWGKLHVVRCGLDLSALPARRIREGRCRIIAVGRLSSEKGYAGLLHAFASLPQPRPELAIVGDGPLQAALLQQAGQLGVAHNVRFLGRLPEADTLEQIANSDVLVLPSFMEGLPVVLMEALALGVPVISSRIAGVPELVEDGINGLLFSPSDWGELATRLRTMTQDEALRYQLGAHGPEAVRSKFDVMKSAEALIALLQSNDRFVPMSPVVPRPES